MENLARYIIRASFSQERMTYIREASKVTYKSNALLSIIRASIPLALLRILNTAVGLLLIIYGVIRLCKIVINTKAMKWINQLSGAVLTSFGLISMIEYL